MGDKQRVREFFEKHPGRQLRPMDVSVSIGLRVSKVIKLLALLEAENVIEQKEHWGGKNRYVLLED